MDTSPPSLSGPQLLALADAFADHAVETAGPLTAEILSGGRSNPTFT
ncbi:MAG: phosphotransferase family protein, partial [Actinomycetales bacterium]